MRRTLPLTLLLLLGCPGDDDDGDDDSDALRWFATCGDPACSGYDGPFDGVPICSDEALGDPCAEGGAQCDRVDDCNTFLVCATSDPAGGPGGCPISLAAHKKEIAYLDDDATRAAASAALRTRLATWRYRWEDAAARPHLGFVIDDQPAGSPAVLADGEHVDLYGYTSQVLAAVQAQHAELEALRAEVAALRAELAASGIDAAACPSSSTASPPAAR